MDLFLAHIPHLALLLGVGLLFVRMMIGETRMQVVLADGGEEAAQQVKVVSMRGAIRTLILMLFLAAIVVMGAQALRDQPPSAFVVVDYLLAGAVLAVWMAWSAPQGLAPGARERMGAVGRGVVRVAVAIVALGSMVIAGMALAHGVVLPPL